MANACNLPLPQRPLLQPMARRGKTRTRRPRKTARIFLRRQWRQLATETRLWNATAEWANSTGTPPVLPFFGNLNRYPYSNHALVRMRYKKREYLTSEHAYLAEQARRYGLHPLANAWTAGKGGVHEYGRWYDWSNPKHVKAYSTKAFRPFKNPNHPARQAWLRYRDQVMFQIALAKFKGDRGAKRTLLASGHRYLVEASPYDAHWGIGFKATTEDLQLGPLFAPRQWGENRLGKILMAVRNILRIRQQRALLITRRARRFLAKRQQQLEAIRTSTPTDENTLAHFSRALVCGVKRAANPKRTATDTRPMEPLHPLWHNRRPKRRKISSACTN